MKKEIFTLMIMLLFGANLFAQDLVFKMTEDSGVEIINDARFDVINKCVGNTKEGTTLRLGEVDFADGQKYAGCSVEIAHENKAMEGYLDFYLGNPDNFADFMSGKTSVKHVFCSLAMDEGHYNVPIINYCENHLLYFHGVPNVCKGFPQRIWHSMIGNMPILNLRYEPLSKVENRFLKRLFDIMLSGIFLVTIFPVIYLIVGTIIKLTSPGPIFFKQMRTGLNGREFKCYKFRSMRVNDEADKKQATADDPRKTKFGNFLRRSNIDELPQFINVFKGEMSIVGPRPHMLAHTETYARLIDKYMVRHFIKPGVTGWAQTHGFRGETKELSQMEGRVQSDIWYMEHWTLLLDLYIIYKTIANVIVGEKNAY